MHTSYGFKKIFTLYKSPVAQYWYLYTLYFIFFLAPVITRVIRGNGFAYIFVGLIFLLSIKLWKKGVPKCVSGCAGITLHIYLIHTWITGPIRVILRHIGVWGLIPHIIIGFFVGSAINILVCMIVKKVWFFNIFFEPVSTFYNKKTKLKIKKGQSKFN